MLSDDLPQQVRFGIQANAVLLTKAPKLAAAGAGALMSAYVLEFIIAFRNADGGRVATCAIR